MKNIEEIVEVAHAIRNNDKVERLASDSEEFTKLVNEVLFYERIVLCTLSFDLSVDHPHKHADRFVKMLCTVQSKEQQDLFQTTWNILNDSLSTTLCLTYSPRLIAAAAVSLATKFLSMRSSAQSTKPRYLEVFQKFEKSGKLFEYNLAEIRKVEIELVKFYESI